VTGRYFANRTKQSTKGEQKLWKWVLHQETEKSPPTNQPTAGGNG
jgi:hypothetical protein